MQLASWVFGVCQKMPSFATEKMVETFEFVPFKSNQLTNHFGLTLLRCDAAGQAIGWTKGEGCTEVVG